MDELQTAGELAAGQFDWSVDNAQLYAEYRRLAAEQAALRRLAALVARGVEPSEVFDAVVKEMRRCLPTDRAGLWRYETSGEITLLAVDHRSPAPVKWPVGTRTPIDGNTLAATVQCTGEPARMDSHENSAGSLAARVREVGVRTAVGVPVIVDGRVWGLAAVGSVEPGPMPADTEARISGFAELIGTAVVAGYRDEQKRQMFDDTSRRSFLIDSLLEGRVFDDCSLCEVAGHLRLPKDGPFVVIAAEVGSGGSEPLPVIESKLRSLDVYSAWRLLPDWQVGIVHVASEQRLDQVVALVSRTAVDRVGVSARFNDLRETPAGSALRQVNAAGPARPRLSGRGVRRNDPGHRRARRPGGDGQIGRHRVGAVWRPSRRGARRSCSRRFGCGRTPTPRWVAAAERLCCHPNTVRYRLRRIEKRTGRSLSRPRDVARTVSGVRGLSPAHLIGSPERRRSVDFCFSSDRRGLSATTPTLDESAEAVVDGADMSNTQAARARPSVSRTSSRCVSAIVRNVR